MNTNAVTKVVEESGLNMETIQQVTSEYAIRIIGSVLVFFIGMWIAKLLRRLLNRLMEQAKLDDTLQSFLRNLSYVTLVVFVVIASIGVLGVPTAQFVALIGAAGLAVGLALQGSLANFAAGVLMIIFKPFRVGDFVEASGVTGTIEEISIFTTTMNTPQNKKAIIPNGAIMNNTIMNYTANQSRRVDLVVGISYESDIDQAREIILEAMKRVPGVLKDPAPAVMVQEMADSSVNLAVRPWSTPADYWDVYFGVSEAVKKALDAGGITIPFPQRDVHLYEHGKKS